MPELPDITIYVESLERFILRHVLESICVRSPFVLRTFEPEISDCHEMSVVGVSRLGKRVVWTLSDEFWLVFHLKVTGRFHWKKAGTTATRTMDLAAFHSDHGTPLFIETSRQKQVSLNVHSNRELVVEHDRGGLNVLKCFVDAFASRLKRENHTLKKALVDPRLFDGIGNAYSEEILHAARLSPAQLTSRLGDVQTRQLYEAIRNVLITWTDKLRSQVGNCFPEKVTEFHRDMAVHEKFRQPCPECGSPVQRIVSLQREINNCPDRQTNGRILKDRSLSRLLNDNWPDTLDDLRLWQSAGHWGARKVNFEKLKALNVSVPQVLTLFCSGNALESSHCFKNA